MKPLHHLSDELVMAMAAGLLAEPLLLLARTHTALCGECRERERELRIVGGAVLEAAEAVTVSPELRERVLDALGEDVDERLDSRAHSRSIGGEMGMSPGKARAMTVRGADVPEPLVPLIGPRFSALKWRSLGPVSEYRLLTDVDGYITRLMKIRPGAGVPQHTHDGIEATVVIKGAFRDCTGRYGPGDIALVDGDLDHSPVAAAGEPCICLAVTDAPLRFTGRIGRFLNPFMRL